MKIVIKGRPISKKNNRRNFGHTSLPSKAFQKFHTDAMQQLIGVKSIKAERYSIGYYFYMKGKLDTDVDNMMAGINDILQDARIISNDKNIVEGSFVKIPGCPDWTTKLTIEAV